MAGAAGVIAVIAMLIGILGFWTLRVATDSERFENRVESLLATEEVSDTLANRIVAELSDALDLRAEIDNIVPRVMQPAVNVLLAGVRSRVELRLGEILRSDESVKIVGTAAGTAHRTAIKVLEGDNVVDGVAIVDGEVRVDLLPLMARAIRLTQEEIGLFRDVDVPDLQRGGDPDEQRAQLAEALGRPLPDDFGTPVVFRSDSLDEVGSTVQTLQDLLLLARRTFWALLIIGFALAGVAIWMAAERWRAASFVVAGLFVVTLLVRWVVARSRERLPDVVEQPGARATVSDIASGLEHSLNSTMLGFSVIALIVLVAAAAVSSRYPRPTASTTPVTAVED